jgi:hypothetical protein
MHSPENPLFSDAAPARRLGIATTLRATCALSKPCATFFRRWHNTCPSELLALQGLVMGNAALCQIFAGIGPTFGVALPGTA